MFHSVSIAVMKIKPGIIVRGIGMRKDILSKMTLTTTTKTKTKR